MSKQLAKRAPTRRPRASPVSRAAQALPATAATRSSRSTTRTSPSLRQFISEKGKIRSRRITGACRRHQNQIAQRRQARARARAAALRQRAVGDARARWTASAILLKDVDELGERGHRRRRLEGLPAQLPDPAQARPAGHQGRSIAAAKRRLEPAERAAREAARSAPGERRAADQDGAHDLAAGRRRRPPVRLGHRAGHRRRRSARRAACSIDRRKVHLDEPIRERRHPHGRRRGRRRRHRHRQDHGRRAEVRKAPSGAPSPSSTAIGGPVAVSATPRGGAAAEHRGRAVGARRDAALRAGALRARDRGRRLRPEDFYRDAHRVDLTRRCSRLTTRAEPVDALTVSRRSSSSAASSRTAGGQAYVDELAGGGADRRQRAPLRADRQGATRCCAACSTPPTRSRPASHDHEARRASSSSEAERAALRGRPRRPPEDFRSIEEVLHERARQARAALARGHVAHRHAVRLQGPRRDHRRLPARQPDHPRRAPVDGQDRAGHEHRRERRASTTAGRWRCSRSRCPRPSSRSASSPRQARDQGRRPAQGPRRATSDWPKIVEASRAARRRRRCTSTTPRDIGILEMRAKARRLHQQASEHGGLGLIIVDYLQLMRADARVDSRVAAGRRDEPRAEDPRARARACR